MDDASVEESGLRLGPIADHLEVLATSRDLPAHALAVCTARIGEAGPLLRALLDRAAAGEALEDREYQLLYCGLHVLGAVRDTAAGAALLRLLRRPPEEVEKVLGDAITENLPKILAGVFDGDAEPLFAAIADESLDQFVRNSMFGAATFLTWEGRIAGERMRAFLEYFHRERLAPDSDYAWVGWQEAIALLGLTDFVSLVRQAWAEGRLDDEFAEPESFDDDLAAALRAPSDKRRFEDAHLGYLDDAVEALGRFQWGNNDAADRDWEAADDDDDFLDAPEWAEPAVNPWRNVGRNDPCPCGSGRKFKKCCLPAVGGSE
jgi:hypothetical protein